jgi:hypothetical protein
LFEIEKKICTFTTEYFIKGTRILHREDGPACTDRDGTKMWYINDMCHREDGPAVVYPNGRFEWWVNGKRHRVDGPSAIYSDGILEWCLNDYQFNTKKEWFDALTEEQKEKVLYSEYFIRG